MIIVILVNYAQKGRFKRRRLLTYSKPIARGA